MKKIKTIFVMILIGITLVSIISCRKKEQYSLGELNGNKNEIAINSGDNEVHIEDKVAIPEMENFINAEGDTLESRINTPGGYSRIEYPEEGFETYLRHFPLKADGSKVLLYNGDEKGNQSAYLAVFDMNISNRDLQQCADSVMRIYAEYYYANKQYDQIKFHFVNGFLCEYQKWQEGYRIQVTGNDVSWAKTKGYDDSYEAFERYLDTVFAYASTLSLDQESTSIRIEDLKVGTVFLKAGSPGHVVMVVDLCENAEGEKAFLLAQGYMPAQEFHVLKNPSLDTDPWYYVQKLSYPLETGSYSFDEGSLKQLSY